MAGVLASWCGVVPASADQHGDAIDYVSDFYDGTRSDYNCGPSMRVNEHFNASLGLQVNDVDLLTGSFVSTLVTSRINYNFNTACPQRADSVQHGLGAAQLEPPLQLHRPSAQ